MSTINIKNSILRIIEEQKILDENEQISTIANSYRGTGFLINKLGYFITAKHVIDDPRDINNYKIIYKGKKYSISKVEGISYKDNSTDIAMFKANINTTFNYTNIRKINEENIEGDVFFFGYSNTEEEISLEQFSIYKFKNGFFKIKNQQKQLIQEGYSGSPVFQKNDDFTIKIIGVISSSSKGTYIHHVSSINLVKNINFEIKNSFKDKIKFASKCKKTSFITKIRLLFCRDRNKPRLFYELHRKVEHELIKIEYDLKINKGLTKKARRARIQQVLIQFKRVFDVIAGDVSVHIKLIEKVDNESGQAFCKAISRVASKREEDIRPRDSIEQFVISNEFDVTELSKQQESFSLFNEVNPLEPKKINSSYNQVCHSPYKYWFCNDLQAAIKQGKYYSSSEKFHLYYNSLAIFVIADKDMENNIIPLNSIKGLLVIDSKDIGAFDKYFIREVGGYLTHKLNRFLSLEYFEDFFQNCNLLFKDN